MRKLTAKGFSLVELMVVVAIIGILATIAVPQVSKFMAKAKQSEAKSNLSSLYSAEKAFFAEYNGYASRFTIVGFSPEGVLKYNIGFSADSGNGPLNYTNNNNQSGVAGDSLASTYCQNNAARPCRLGTEATTITAMQQATVPGPNFNTFSAGASGRLRQGAGTTDDRWTMSDLRVLTNTMSGI